MSRWRPQRAGICNIWRYYDEVFTFDHGRLLLRGPNGSGKSKALELLLPFLFDASTQPSRLSTFGGSSRTMHWNLMDGVTTKTRTGYVWFELAHDDGAVVTIGAWLQASRERNSVHVAYFMTGQRVGEDLELLGPEQAPHTLAGLRGAIGEHGRVYDTAEAYRTAVRERLFPGMDAERYDTLLRALLQLRTPKLSEHLDPEQLSTVLSSALPPIDEAIITELAEGFERLDQHRQDLNDLEGQVTCARSLASEAQRYARAVIRDRSLALTAATGKLDQASDEHRRGSERLATLDRAAKEATEAQRAAVTVRDECAAMITALEKSEDYAQGRKLDDLRKRVGDAQETAQRTKDDLTRAEREADRAGAGARDALSHAQNLRTDVEQSGAALLTQAHRVLRGEIGTLPSMPVLDDAPQVALRDEIATDANAPSGLDPYEAWRSDMIDGLGEIDARVNARTADIEAVTQLMDAHERAVVDRTTHEGLVETARTALTTSQEKRTVTLDDLDAAVAQQEKDVRAWLAETVELSLDPVAVLDALDAEADRARSGAPGATRRIEDATTGQHAVDEHHDATGRRPDFRGLVEDALSAVRSRSAAALALLTAEDAGLIARHDEAKAEKALLTSDVPLAPPRPAWRAGENPDHGAPLWRLVDPRDDLDPSVTAGIEAALESSGLLDAWVFPDGLLRLDGTDLVLGAGQGRGPGEAMTLAALLVPDAQQHDVPVAVVEAVLASIGLRTAAADQGGEGITTDQGTEAVTQAWVASDGRWKLGPLHGRWTKAHAQFLGAAARERHRTERLAELDALLNRIDADREDVQARSQHEQNRTRTATDEAGRRPQGEEVTAAAASLTRAEAAVQSADASLARARTALAEAERDVARHWARAEAEALQTGLPTSLADLKALSSELAAVRDAVRTLRQGIAPAVREIGHAHAALRAATRARSEHAKYLDRLERDQLDATNLAAQLAELDSTSGATFQMVQDRINQHTTQLKQATAAANAHGAAARTKEYEAANLRGKLESSAQHLDQAQQTRDATQEDLRWVLGTNLATEAGDVLPAEQVLDTVKGVLEVARAVSRSIPADGRGLSRLANQLNEHVSTARSALAQRAELEIDYARDTALPAATYNGRRMSMRELCDSVTAERDRAHAEITAEEHKLFRNILTGQTRHHLSMRIRDAQDLVDDMNGRLATVQTASGVQVRLVWEVRDDESPLLAPARALLLKSAARLSDDDEEALVTFLEERIERARTVEADQPWARQLAKVFDYAQWHTFQVETTRNDGAGWSKVTKRQHSAMSGGEKAIILHLPLFAALAAHYKATEGAPRLILLDEVFVGIDTSNRGQIFGLLRDLDLDFVLTSDHEWCAYPQVDGIAIHVLAADPDDAAVTSTRFVWTGSELVEDELQGLLL